jgi:hypothetical protein
LSSHPFVFSFSSLSSPKSSPFTLKTSMQNPNPFQSFSVPTQLHTIKVFSPNPTKLPHFLSLREADSTTLGCEKKNKTSKRVKKKHAKKKGKTVSLRRP